MYTNAIKKFKLEYFLRKFLATVLRVGDAEKKGTKGDLPLMISDEGQSFTDGKRIVIGPTPSMIETAKKAIYGDDELTKEQERSIYISVSRALIGHEVQHILSSSFPHIEAISIKAGEIFEDAGMVRYVGAQLGPQFLNIIEDGRIERISGNHFPGLVKDYILLNMSVAPEIPENTDLFRAYLTTLLAFSKRGEFPKGIESYPEVQELFEETLCDLVDNGVLSPTNQGCFDATVAVIEASLPFLKEHLPSPEEVDDYQSDYSGITGSDESDSGDTDSDDAGKSIRKVRHKSQSSNSSGKEGSKPQKKQDSKSEDTSEETPSNSSGEGNNSPTEEQGEFVRSTKRECPGVNDGGEDDKESGTSQGSDESQDSQEYPSPEDDSGKTPSSEESQESSEEKGKENPSQSQDQSQGQEGNGDESEDSEESQNEGNASGSSDLNQDSDSQANPISDESAKGTGNDGSEEGYNHTETKTLIESLKKHGEELGETYDRQMKELSRLAREQKPDPALPKTVAKGDLAKVVVNQNNFGVNGVDPIPQEVSKLAKVLKREVTKVMNVERAKINQCATGRIDRKALPMASRGLTDTPFSQVKDVQTTIAVSIIIDRSGSMASRVDDKMSRYDLVCLASAIVEEAFRGMISLKISFFNEGNRGANMDVIKNFSDIRGTVNRSWNATRNLGPSGCNSDDFNIAYASEELLNRFEDHKILLVLSDGQPAGYLTRGTEGVRDVVKKYRARGIDIISLMFGPEGEFKNFAFMYEKDFGRCEPADLPKVLPRLMGKILLRS